MKRSIDLVDDICAEMRPTKRLSMLHNTPKQWKEQRKNILKLSKNKLKAMGDVESNLRKSVLINNTYKKMRRELKEQCPYSSGPSHLAPYTSESCSNKRKSNNGYISMAKEDLEDSEIVTREGIMSMETDSTNSLSQYAAIDTNSVLTNSTSANNDLGSQIKTQYDQDIESVTEDINCEEQDLPFNDPTATSDDHSTVFCSYTSKPKLMDPTAMDNMSLRPMVHGCQSDDVNAFSQKEEVIDLTLKAKDLSNDSDHCKEHSPHAKNFCLDNNDKLGHTYTQTCSPEPCSSIAMDLHVPPGSPCEKGQDMTTTNDAKACTDQPMESTNEDNNDQLNLTKVDQEQQNKSASSSQECEDFSLCKFASRPLSNLPNLFTPDVIPSFSTSSLVSILAAREYHSSTHTYSSALFSCTTTFSDADSIPSQINDYAMDFSKKSEDGNELKTQEVVSPSNDNTLNTQHNNIPHLLGLDDFHAIDQNVLVENNRAMETNGDGLCSSLVSCDIDVNQHNWACFQHFSMAVACS